MTWQRRREPERMDDPQLDERLHRQALAGLRRLNRWSLAGKAIWKSIERQIHQSRTPELRILDLACGSGDVSLTIARLAEVRGRCVAVTGADRSSTAVAEAQRQAVANHRDRQGTVVRFIQLDVLNDPLPTDCDVVMCSLFLHHLDESQATALLQRMRDVARKIVLVDDLRRTHAGYWLAWLASRTLSRSPVVHFDAPLSVQGAFTSQEALQLAEQAGLHGASIRHHWPQRFLLEWSRDK